jgi:hypothetical protein
MTRLARRPGAAARGTRCAVPGGLTPDRGCRENGVSSHSSTMLKATRRRADPSQTPRLRRRGGKRRRGDHPELGAIKREEKARFSIGRISPSQPALAMAHQLLNCGMFGTAVTAREDCTARNWATCCSPRRGTTGWNRQRGRYADGAEPVETWRRENQPIGTLTSGWGISQTHR